MLNDCLRDGDTEEFMFALRQILKVFGSMEEVAKITGIDNETLCKSISNQDTISLKTLMCIASSLKMNLAFVPKTQNAFASV